MMHLRAKSWVRNLGHELSGARPVRRQAKARLKQLSESLPRLKMLRRGADHRAALLWRTASCCS
eukprot:1475565-Pyramimonas_sp.AAC.1